MIGWLSGKVIAVTESASVIVDVAGVGYEVQLASSDLPGSGASVEYFIYTVVREDALHLYGFLDLAGRQFFELLIGTPGVGPATALGALRRMSVAELARAIESEDVKKVATLPGIGPKTASRIVLELKGKFLAYDGATDGVAPERVAGAIDEALRALGYSAREVHEALAGVELPDDESQALRMALTLLRRP